MNDANINILYDITMLGIGYTPLGKAEGLRSGIFRVIEEVAQQLACREECRLTFYAEVGAYLSGLEYLKASPVLHDIALPPAFALQKHQTALAHAFARQPLLQRVTRKAFKEYYKARNIYLPLSPAALSQADIVHATYYPLPPQAKAARHVQRFLTVYDIIPLIYPHYFPAGRQTLHDALDSLGPEDWVLTISESVKNDLCDHLKMDPARVFVAPLAANEANFHPCRDAQAQASVRQKYNIPAGQYMLSLSTLEPRKNIEHVLRSFARLLEQQSIEDLYLVLTGGKGWDCDRLFAAFADSSLLKERVIVTGYVADADLAALYSGALAFTYMSHYEGFGLPPLEAMQCGTPVITSNTSSLPEVVGDAGVMLAPNDMDGWCQTLLALYCDAELRTQMAQRSLERAKHFSWQRCGDLTVAAYKAALNAGS